MFKKEIERLENSIVLSIQYSRLLEEIDDTQNKIEVIKGKKIDLSKTKKIELNENYILEVKKVIQEIEENFYESRYSIVKNKQLDEKLSLLSSCKDYETIKYNIAIRTVLDHAINYQNTDDYLEMISEILFDDKKKMTEIKKELYKVYGFLNDTNLEVPYAIDDGIKAVAGAVVAAPAVIKPFWPNLKKVGLVVFNAIKKHPKVAIALAATGAAVALGGGAIKGILKVRKQSNAFKKLTPDDLEYVLLVNALCISVASKYMDEVEFYKYFQNKMRVINASKKKIDKDLFVKWYEKVDNARKIFLLNKFDEYLIKHTNFVKR